MVTQSSKLEDFIKSYVEEYPLPQDSVSSNTPQTTIPHNSLVSVIIPVYNVKPFLSEALESIVKQTYQNLEVIVVDDGSEDGSSEICDKYAARDSRIIVIHETNKGLSAARNAGLEIMTGKAVMFLDSDDAYVPNAVETLMSTMIQQKVDIVEGQNIVCHCRERMTTGYRKQSPKKSFKVLERKDALSALLYGRINTVVWGKIYRSDLWKNVRFNEGHVYEDTPAIAQILYLSKRICIIPDVIYFKRIWDGSITNTYSVVNALDGIAGAYWFNSFVQQNNPEIFDDKQVQYSLEKYLGILIIWFVNCIYEKNKEGKALMDDITRIISDDEMKEVFRACRIRYRVEYWLACHYPEYLNYLMKSYNTGKRIFSRKTNVEMLK